MKRTPEDDVFLEQFASQLRSFYDKATADGVTDENFAVTLGISRAALKKYLSGTAMPCLRSVVLAYTQYGLLVPYLGVPLFTGRKRQLKRAAVQQLELPFEIRALSQSQVDMKLESKGANQFQLRVHIKSAG